MKEKDARINAGHTFVIYVEKDDATYGPVKTGSVMARDYFDDYLMKRKHLEEDCLRRLRNGEISPVAYHMALIGIAEADLARRVGIRRRKLRRHLTPDGFARIGLPLARRYAEVFGVPVANLFQVILPESEDIQVRQEKTASLLVVVTRIGRGPA